jgi:hypothetical protein
LITKTFRVEELGVRVMYLDHNRERLHGMTDLPLYSQKFEAALETPYSKQAQGSSRG